MAKKDSAWPAVFFKGLLKRKNASGIHFMDSLSLLAHGWNPVYAVTCTRMSSLDGRITGLNLHLMSAFIKSGRSESLVGNRMQRSCTGNMEDNWSGCMSPIPFHDFDTPSMRIGV